MVSPACRSYGKSNLTTWVTYALSGSYGQWSKATYTYGEAACLATVGDHGGAAKLMEKVSGLRQRIAGKSIPLEVGHEVVFYAH